MFNEIESVQSVSKAITHHLNFKFDSKEYNDAFRLCIRYVTRQLNASQFQAELRKTGNANPKLRAALSNSIYFLRNFRAFVLMMTTLSRSDCRATGKKYEIDEDDVLSLRRNFGEIALMEVEESVLRRVCRVKSLDAKLSSIIGEIKKFNENFVRKKLFFILNSCNYEVHDLASELTCKAILTFYAVAIDCKTKLHTLNCLRLTCKNHGNNMINYFTAKKRSRLNKVGDNTFALTVVSENQLMKTMNDDDSGTPYDEMLAVDNTSSMVLNIAVNQVMQKYANLIDKGSNVDVNSKKISLMKLLMGYPDESFNKFLYSMGIKYDNDEYIDRVQPKRYIELVTKYLQLGKQEISNFMATLRVSLA